MAAEYQEPTRMLCDLPWSGWRCCYVIFHVKPLKLLAVFEPMIIVFDRVQAMLLFIMMIWYHRHYYDGMIWYHPRLCDETIWYPPEISAFSNP